MIITAQDIDTLIHRLKAECRIMTHADMPELYPSDFSEPVIALDLETSGLDTRLMYDTEGNISPQVDIVGVALATSSDTSYYIPVGHNQKDGNMNWSIGSARQLLNCLNQEFLTINHNGLFDREVQTLHGVELQKWPYWIDTMLLSYLYHMPGKHGLKDLSEALLGKPMASTDSLFDAKEKNFNFATLSASDSSEYAEDDAKRTYELWQFYTGIEQFNYGREQALATERDHDFIDVLRVMRRAGMPVNQVRAYYTCLDAISRQKTMRNYLIEWLQERGFTISNLNSWPQVQKLLYRDLKLPVIDVFDLPTHERKIDGEKVRLEDNQIIVKDGDIRTDPPTDLVVDVKGKLVRVNKNKVTMPNYFSTDSKVQEILFKKYPDNEVLSKLAEYKSIQKYMNTWVMALLVDSYNDGISPGMKVSPAYYSTSTKTGRLSSGGGAGLPRYTHTGRYVAGDGTARFNAQNLPHNIREKTAKKLTKIPVAIQKYSKEDAVALVDAAHAKLNPKARGLSVQEVEDRPSPDWTPDIMPRRKY